MNAVECITGRRSCRKFLDKPVEKETLEQIVDLARFAPSWKNTQIVRYTVVQDKELKAQIAENHVFGYGFNSKTLQRAAALCVVSYETGVCGLDDNGKHYTADGEKWEMFDAGIAAQTFCLAAREREVGTCILGIGDTEAIHDAIHLPESQKVACIIAMGYPEEWKAAPPRKDVSELLNIL